MENQEKQTADAILASFKDRFIAFSLLISKMFQPTHLFGRAAGSHGCGKCSLRRLPAPDIAIHADLMALPDAS
ncbi:MAG: hypothetical protein WCA32_08005 [Chromatiaceae bacterium]